MQKPTPIAQFLVGGAYPTWLVIPRTYEGSLMPESFWYKSTA